jgi:hypothetical protein
MILRKIPALILGTAALLYMGFLGLLYFSQSSIIYPERRTASIRRRRSRRAPSC